MSDGVSGLVRKLKGVVGDNHLLRDTDLTAGYSTDWTGRFQGHTPLVIRPANTAEVAEVVMLTAEAGFAIVPQGGNTGLV